MHWHRTPKWMYMVCSWEFQLGTCHRPLTEKPPQLSEGRALRASTSAPGPGAMYIMTALVKMALYLWVPALCRVATETHQQRKHPGYQSFRRDAFEVGSEIYNWSVHHLFLELCDRTHLCLDTQLLFPSMFCLVKALL